MRVDHYLKITTLLISLIWLTACGEGVINTKSDAETTTVSGIASKGIIQYGIIKVEELDASGNRIAIVGNAETDVEGRYSLAVDSSYKGGALFLTITGKADGSTKMKCDVRSGCGADISFGESITLGPDFQMNAVVPPGKTGEQGGTISAQITPFTHMAAARVLATGKSDADTVNNAISEVNQIVGVNILDTEPVDITNPASVQKADSSSLTYSAFLAGVGSIIMANSNIQTGLDNLAASFEDGALDEANDAVTPSALLTAVRNETEANNFDTNGMLERTLAAIEYSMDCSGNNCVYNPEPASSATLSDIGKARDIVSQTRAWGSSLATLETPIDLFGANIEIAGKVLDQNSFLLTKTLGLVIDSVAGVLKEKAGSGTLDLGSYETNIVDGLQYLGRATVVLSDDNGLKITITATLLNGISIDLLGKSNAPANEILAAYNNTHDRLVLDEASLIFSGTVSNANVSVSLDELTFTTTFFPFTVDYSTGTPPSDPRLTSANLSGKVTITVSDGTAFSGEATVEFVPLTSGPGAFNNMFGMLSLREISLSGSFTDATGNNNFKANALLKINNAEQIDVLGGMACEDWVEDLYRNFSTEGFFGGLFGSPRFQAREFGDLLDAEQYAAELGIVELYSASYSRGAWWWSNETYFMGIDADGEWSYITVPGDVLNAEPAIINYFASSPHNPECVLPSQTIRYPSFVFNKRGYDYNPFYGEDGGTTEFSAIIDLPSTGEKLSNITLTLGMELALDGYPDTSVILTANPTVYFIPEFSYYLVPSRSRRLAYLLGTMGITATLLHDGQSITFATTTTNVGDSFPLSDGFRSGINLTVTTPDGAALDVNIIEGSTVGTVTVDNRVVGTLEESFGGVLIRYIDGSFETIN